MRQLVGWQILGVEVSAVDGLWSRIWLAAGSIDNLYISAADDRFDHRRAGLQEFVKTTRTYPVDKVSYRSHLGPSGCLSRGVLTRVGRVVLQ